GQHVPSDGDGTQRKGILIHVVGRLYSAVGSCRVLFLAGGLALLAAPATALGLGSTPSSPLATRAPAPPLREQPAQRLVKGTPAWPKLDSTLGSLLEQGRQTQAAQAVRTRATGLQFRHGRVRVEVIA